MLGKIAARMIILRTFFPSLKKCAKKAYKPSEYLTMQGMPLLWYVLEPVFRCYSYGKPIEAKCSFSSFDHVDGKGVENAFAVFYFKYRSLGECSFRFHLLRWLRWLKIAASDAKGPPHCAIYSWTHNSTKARLSNYFCYHHKKTGTTKAKLDSTSMQHKQ